MQRYIVGSQRSASLGSRTRVQGPGKPSPSGSYPPRKVKGTGRGWGVDGVTEGRQGNPRSEEEQSSISVYDKGARRDDPTLQ